MGPAPQQQEVGAGLGAIRRLVEHLLSERHCLVAADDQRLRKTAAHLQRLAACQLERQFVRSQRAVFDLPLDGPFVDLRRHGLEFQSGIFHQHAA